MGEIKDDLEQRKQWAAHRETGRRRKADMECHSCHQKDTSRGSARSTELKDAREMGRHNKRGAPGRCGDGGDGNGREQTISPRADRGEQGQLPG